MKQLKYVGFVRNELSGYVNWIGHMINVHVNDLFFDCIR